MFLFLNSATEVKELDWKMYEELNSVHRRALLSLYRDKIAGSITVEDYPQFDKALTGRSVL